MALCQTGVREWGVVRLGLESGEWSDWGYKVVRLGLESGEWSDGGVRLWGSFCGCWAVWPLAVRGSHQGGPIRGVPSYRSL